MVIWFQGFFNFLNYISLTSKLENNLETKETELKNEKRAP